MVYVWPVIIKVHQPGNLRRYLTGVTQGHAVMSAVSCTRCTAVGDLLRAAIVTTMRTLAAVMFTCTLVSRSSDFALGWARCPTKGDCLTHRKHTQLHLRLALSQVV